MRRRSRDEIKGEQGQRSMAASSTTSGSSRTTSSGSVAACRKEEEADPLFPRSERGSGVVRKGRELGVGVGV
jgi:hypothetical protein